MSARFFRPPTLVILGLALLPVLPAAGGLADLSLVPVATGLASPVAITHAGDGRLDRKAHSPSVHGAVV